MKTILWFIFFVIALALYFQIQAFASSGYQIYDLELANAEHGLKILAQWHILTFGDQTMIDIARSNTRWDFLFIAVYTVLLIVMSNWQMQRETFFPLNEALRMNLFLSVLIALSDVFENIGMLHNFHHFNDPEHYCNTHWFALIKFILLGVVLFVFSLSFVKSLLNKKRNVVYTS